MKYRIILSLLLVLAFVEAEAYRYDTEQTITVSITENDYLTQHRIRDITSTIYNDREENGKFAGWNNALATINNTSLSFEYVKSDGDVQITLVNYPSSKYYSGTTFLKSSSPGIINAEITIYEIEELSGHELQMVMRHELGHVLGLDHSDDNQDLMYPVIPYYNSYISSCNIMALSHNTHKEIKCEK